MHDADEVAAHRALRETSGEHRQAAGVAAASRRLEETIVPASASTHAPASAPRQSARGSFWRRRSLGFRVRFVFHCLDFLAVLRTLRRILVHDFRRAPSRGRIHPDYEIDHLIPLCLGGSDDPSNLWPQPRRSVEETWNAEAKDRLERLMCNMVCEGQIDIATAQEALARLDRGFIGPHRHY
jgi:hypothetical protein